MYTPSIGRTSCKSGFTFLSVFKSIKRSEKHRQEIAALAPLARNDRTLAS